jgi:hypothetical protein
MEIRVCLPIKIKITDFLTVESVLVAKEKRKTHLGVSNFNGSLLEMRVRL